MGHGDLADVAVHAVPSPMTEDDLKITATVKEGATLTEEELFRWCIDQLPYFALPRYIEFRDALPAEPGGPRPQARAARRGCDRGDLGRRGRRDHLRAPLTPEASIRRHRRRRPGGSDLYSLCNQLTACRSGPRRNATMNAEDLILVSVDDHLVEPPGPVRGPPAGPLRRRGARRSSGRPTAPTCGSSTAR